MDCICPISADLAEKIFDGRKILDFRSADPMLHEGDKVYLYETKKTGCGKVVGYYIVDSWKRFDYEVDTCTYLYMDMYANLFSDKETQRLVKKAKSIQLNDYNNDFVLNYLFMESYLDEMLKTHTAPDINFFKMSSKELQAFNDTKKKQDSFLYACDNWLRTIGFYNQDEKNSASWMIEIKMKEAHKFDTPKPISDFKNRKGKPITKAPSVYCYIS